MTMLDADMTVLKERARALAKPLEAAVDLSSSVEVMVFSSAQVSYALDTRFIQSVVTFDEVVPVPGAPAALAGLIDLRGGLLVLVDLEGLLRGASVSVVPMYAIVCGTRHAELGLGVEAALDVRRVALSEILPLAEASEAALAIVQGVTRDGLWILDGTRLLADERLWLRPLE